MAAVSLNVPKDYPRSLCSSFGEWNSKILFECSAFKLADQAFLYFFFTPSSSIVTFDSKI